jgi:hypothetical protein
MSWWGNYRRNADADIQALLQRYLSSGNPELINKYIWQLEKIHGIVEGSDVDPEVLKHYIWALDQAGDLDDHHEEILASLAKGFFVSAWAHEIDVRGISPGGNYYYDSPPTPPDAVAYAKEYLKDLIKEIGLDLNAFYAFVLRIADPKYGQEITPEHFGYLISASAVGSGVGLWEVVPSPLQAHVEVPYGENYEIEALCDICGSVYMPDDNRYVICDNDACTGGDREYEGQDDLRATICDDCRFGCEACDVILCTPCGDDHECEVDVYDPDTGDIATEDYNTWFQYGELYHTGSLASLWKKLDEDKFWPNVFSISDHGNVSPPIIRGEDGNDEEDEEEEDWACGYCGHDEVIVPTFCNSEHCSECFLAVEEDHESCAWEGDEDYQENPDAVLRVLERRALNDPEARRRLAHQKFRAGMLPSVTFNPGARLLIENHGYASSSLQIAREEKETLLAHFGLYTHAVPGTPYPAAYMAKQRRIQKELKESGRGRRLGPIKEVPDRAYYYMDLMDLREGGGAVMTILVGNELLDLIMSDLSTVIAGGDIWYAYNPNPRVKEFIRHVYESGEETYPVFSIEPLNPELWRSYGALR